MRRWLVPVTLLIIATSAGAHDGNQQFEGLWVSRLLLHPGNVAETTFLSITGIADDHLIVVSQNDQFRPFSYFAGGEIKEDGKLWVTTYIRVDPFMMQWPFPPVE
jgi:hypothetical protein